jgi:peptidoglycan/xylan/chitin deacetylase (PgdA/CDA1 family)
MKNKYVGGAVVGTLFLGSMLAFSLSTLAATNLVPNGSFETASTDPTIPQGWTKDSWGTLTPVFTYPVAGNGSAKAAKVQLTAWTSGDAKWMFNHIPVTAGKTYQFSDDYNSNVATNLTIEYKNASGVFSYIWLADLPSSANTWKTYSGTFTVPAGMVSMSVLHTIQSVGVLTIDNVSVVDPSAGPPAPTCAMSVNPTSVQNGSSAKLSWTSQNATAASIDNGVGSVGVNASTTVSPAQTTTYTGTFTNNGVGTTSCATTLAVTAVPTPKPVISSFSANPTSIAQGSSTQLSWVVSGASSTSISPTVGVVTGNSTTVSPTQTTTYTLTATNPGGSVTATTSVTVVVPPPPPPPAKPIISSFSANPSSIASGSSTVLSWSVSGASSTSIDNGVGVVTGSSKSVTPTQTTTYTLTATNPGGSVTATASVTVSSPPPPPPSSNLIANGNLEAGTTNAPTGWHADFWGTETATFTYPVAGNGSARAAKVVVSNWQSGDAKWWFTHVPVNSSTIYEFSDDYISTVTDNITVEITMSNGTNSYQWVGEAPATAANTWRHYTTQISVPVGAVSMTVYHSLDKNGSLTIDNASLIALPANPFPTGMVTFTFDDGLTDQYTNGRSIMNTAGIKASYGIITQEVRDINGDTAAMTWAQITQLKNDGHEISSHTRTHPDLTTLTAAQQQSEIVGAKNDLIAKGFNPTTFIYPFGAENPSLESQVKAAGYIGARNSYWGLNGPTNKRYAVNDVRYDKATTAAQINALVDQAIADKRWLIIELHDILPTGGDTEAITPTKLQAVVNHVKAIGAKTVTLGEGMAFMQSQ